MPQEKIEEIRTSLDIVEVIGEYVQLSKQGREYVGLCPFHSEKSPSFSVSADKQLYHCFGCGAGGNLFTFLMDIESVSFTEAAQLLAERAHIDLGVAPTPDTRQARASTDQSVLNGFELLTKFYHYLLTTAKFGSEAQQYLQNRRFTSEMIERFQIGFAINSWHAATDLLEKRGIDVKQMAKVGVLASRGFDNRYFDRFRNRIIFPIADRRGRTVAVAGRTLADEKPKYLNTPESDLFHKGDLLYGYHLARPHIRKMNQVILLEGYVDVIRAHQAGLTWSVASMGTSLTPQQAAMLRRLAQSIVICYDGDDAGVEAAARAAEMLTGGGRLVKIAVIPQNLDPDDYIVKFGGEQFRHDVIGAARTLTAFKVDYLRRKRNMSDEGDRLLYVEDVLKVIGTLDKAVERDHYLRQLADEFSLSLEALKTQERQQRRALLRQQRRTESTDAKQFAKQHHLPPAYETAERKLLARMMRDRSVSERVQQAIGGNFFNDLHQALAAYLYVYYAEGNPPDETLFIQTITDRDLQKCAVGISLMASSAEDEEREINDCLQQIHKHAQDKLIAEKDEKRRLAEQSGQAEEAARLLAEAIQLRKGLNGTPDS
ncbi:MAG: DNA primase [Sporolactobacillus sp.]